MESESFHLIDLLIIAGYVVLLVILSTWKGAGKSVESQLAGDAGSGDKGEEGFLLASRRITLPAFVATLVSTWYGGILGVGEFTFLYGVSQWVVFGVPYYIFAILFAFFLADKIRVHPAISIPEAIGQVYGKKASRTSAVLIFLLVNPAPYILMVALLAQYLIGFESFVFPVLVAFISAIYVSWGGFGAVVRTDILQAVLMYVGFGILLYFAWTEWGSPIELWASLPEVYTSATGGQSVWYLAVWFFIALWTFVDPSFHQRASAAKSKNVAKNGILVSVGFWFVFDMMALFCALYAVAHLPDIVNVVLVYPELANTLLPLGLKGLFFLALLATIMSTLDSYLFLAGQTLGRDYLTDWLPGVEKIKLSRICIFMSAIIAVVLAWMVPSVIELWFIMGSVLIPGLLFPVLGVYFPRFRVPNEKAVRQFMMPVTVSFVWLMAGVLFTDSLDFLGFDAFYPGLLVAIAGVLPTFLSADVRD